MFTNNVKILGQGLKSTDKSALIEYGDRIYGDAFVVPTSNPDTANVTIFFRMANDFLNFTKVTDRNDLKGNFKAEMSVGLEIRDSLGVIRQRLHWGDVAYTNAFEETNSKVMFHYGWVEFKVGAGSYDVTIDVLNTKESSQKKLQLPTLSFTPRTYKRLLSTPMFAEAVSKNGVALLRPFVFSGSVMFGNKDARALLILADKVNTKYNYTISQLPWNANDIRWWKVSDVIGVTESRTDNFPSLSGMSTTDDPYVELREVSSKDAEMALVEISVPTTTFVPGRYEIALIEYGTTDTVKATFSVLWEMMPLSLRNLNYAFESMKYILTESQLDSLNNGPDAERRERLMDWWRKEDPTPVTTYNERMAEYYKRTDQAFYTYSTIQEPDGAKSERGKIYILFGTPTTSNKKLMPEGEPFEIWTYAAVVKKEFHFQLDSRGIYRLIKIVDL
ncbi:MAG: GWxTD domain-containing protein [Ignavibacteria bacterium]|nr:GWxTD domain-containing protein [Ignavibacteria bacterium]